jgi:hypothetical protein
MRSRRGWRETPELRAFSFLITRIARNDFKPFRLPSTFPAMKRHPPLVRGIILHTLVSACFCALLIPGSAAKADADADRFLVLYPGVPSEHEKAPAAAYFAGNAALKTRGPIDVAALISGKLLAGTPGVGPVIHVTEQWVRYDNDKYDPGDPIRSDKAYAKSLGFQDILAYHGDELSQADECARWCDRYFRGAADEMRRVHRWMAMRAGDLLRDATGVCHESRRAEEQHRGIHHPLQRGMRGRRGRATPPII